MQCPKSSFFSLARSYNFVQKIIKHITVTNVSDMLSKQYYSPLSVNVSERVLLVLLELLVLL